MVWGGQNSWHRWRTNKKKNKTNRGQSRGGQNGWGTNQREKKTLINYRTKNG